METTDWHSPSDSRHYAPLEMAGRDTDKRKNIFSVSTGFFFYCYRYKGRDIKIKNPKEKNPLYLGHKLFIF